MESYDFEIEKAIKAEIGEIHTWANGDRAEKTIGGWHRIESTKNVINLINKIPLHGTTTITDFKNRVFVVEKVNKVYKNHLFNVYDTNGNLIRNFVPLQPEKIKHVGEPKQYFDKSDGWGLNPSDFNKMKEVANGIYKGFVKGYSKRVYIDKHVMTLADAKNSTITLKQKYQEAKKLGLSDNEEVAKVATSLSDMNDEKFMLVSLKDLRKIRNYTQWGIKSEEEFNKLPDSEVIGYKNIEVDDGNGVVSVYIAEPQMPQKLSHTIHTQTELNRMKPAFGGEYYIEAYKSAIEDGINPDDDVILVKKANGFKASDKFFYVKAENVKKPEDSSRQEVSIQNETFKNKYSLK